MIIPPLKKSYSGKVVLDIPQTVLESGKIYAVLGSNGSGKSTYAKLLAGIISADSKQRIIPRSTRVGYLPQKPYAFRMSLKSNLRLVEHNKDAVDKAVEDFCLTELSKQNADKLSGGETARMALARLMLKSCDLLILDEPTAATDVKSTAQAEQIILNYREKTGCTVLLITHSAGQASRLADEVFFFEGGKIIENGKAQDVLNNPVKEQTKSFLELFSK